MIQIFSSLRLISTHADSFIINYKPFYWHNTPYFLNHLDTFTKKSYHDPMTQLKTLYIHSDAYDDDDHIATNDDDDDEP